MNELNISRIQAYAATPPSMPASRFAAHEELTRFDIEILKITLSNGLEGVASFTSGWGGITGGDVTQNIREIGSRYLGHDVTHRAALTEILLAESGDGPWEAISLFDCAMWDAYTRSLDKPLWQYLGGHRERIPAYASTVAHLTIEKYLEDAEQAVALGYRAIKFHMNTDPDFDLAMVLAVARAYHGSGLRFMIDLEQSYTLDQAVKLGEVLDDLPFEYMEAPLPDEDLDAYVELNNAVKIDVVPEGNILLGLDNWSEGLQRGAWSRLRFDVTNAGGITTAIRAMGLAQSMNIPVELQSFGFQPAQHANLHVMLGLQGCTWFEHPAQQGPYDYATRNPLTLDSQGKVGAVEGPGLGLDIDWEQISADAFETYDSIY